MPSSDPAREQRDTLLLMAGIALSALPQLPRLPWWCGAAFAALFAWRLALTLTRQPLPRAPVRWLAAAAGVLAVWAQYRTLLGREPGVALLVMFLGLKLLEMRARRDLFVVILLCLFMLVTAFFGAQDAPTALAVLAALAALLAALAALHGGVRELPPWKRVAQAGVLLLQALPLAAVLFLLFPRLPGPLWGGSPDGIQGRSGLSDTMSPGDLQQLGLSEEIVFRAEFDGPAPPAGRLYWRGPVLGLFDGRTWRAGRDGVVPPPAPLIEPGRAAAAPARLSYTVTMEATRRGELYALEAPATMPALRDHEVSVTPELTMRVRPAIGDRVRWQGEALLDYRIGANETPLTLQGWLQLPPGLNPATHELARRWRTDETDPRRLVARALDLFARGGFSYTLSPPPLGRHGVDDFLLRTRAGFCEHYASAFVVLMRVLDVPARVVTGYQGGERNPVDGAWVVRQADAHAWAEVWLAGSGWVRVDPTAAIAPDRIERGVRASRPSRFGLALLDDAPLLQSWRLNAEALAHLWNRWLLSYDRARQRELLAALGVPADDWLRLMGLIALAISVPIGVAAVVTLRPRRVDDPLARCWDAFCAKLARAGIERAPHETPNRLLRRAERLLDEPAQRERARTIVSEYNRLRYDSPRLSTDSVRRLSRLIDAFKP